MPWRVAGTLALVAIATLAFGAVYPWAYVPLFAACATFALALLVQPKCLARVDRRAVITLGATMGAISLQLIPLPAEVLRTVSPRTHELLAAYVVGYPAIVSTHPLSIAPELTLTALAAGIVLAALLIALACAIERGDLTLIIRGLAVLGAFLSIVAIAQKGMSTDKIYGFWVPFEQGLPFGPFVNRNHFAGWMLMAMPLTVGYLIGRSMQAMRHVRRDWRSRLVWLSSREANETILIAFAVLLMALGLTMSMSRSGTLGLIGALGLSGWFVIRGRTASISRRGIMTGYFLMVAIVAIGWAGVNELAARFSAQDPMTFGNRTGIWKNTFDIARQFPLFGTGLNTYGVSTLFHQTVMPEKHLAEAHNDYLQLLAEGGLLVGVPVALTFFMIVRAIREQLQRVPRESTEYWIRVGAATALVAIALQEIGDFSLQIPANAVMFIIVLAIAMRRADSSEPQALRRG